VVAQRVQQRGARFDVQPVLLAVDAQGQRDRHRRMRLGDGVRGGMRLPGDQRRAGQRPGRLQEAAARGAGKVRVMGHGGLGRGRRCNPQRRQMACVPGTR